MSLHKRLLTVVMLGKELRRIMLLQRFHFYSISVGPEPTMCLTKT